MIYFSEPVFVSKVEVKQSSGPNLADLTYYEVYGDGQNFWSGKKINEELSSMYLKIARSINSKRIQGTYEGKKYSRSVFDPDLAIAISEVLDANLTSGQQPQEYPGSTHWDIV